MSGTTFTAQRAVETNMGEDLREPAIRAAYDAGSALKPEEAKALVSEA
jgi:hypothetical protein